MTRWLWAMAPMMLAVTVVASDAHASCSSIKDDDERNLCYARSRGESSTLR